MNIVFGSDSFIPVLHGVTTHIILYAKALAEDGHNVLIIAPEYPKSKDIFLGERISIVRFKSYSAGKLFLMKHTEDRFVRPFQKKTLRKTLKEFQPDIIHCHTEFAVGRMLLAYARKYQVPIAMTSHTYFEYYIQFYFPWIPRRICQWFAAKFIEYNFFKHGQLLIAPTQLMKDNLIRYGVKKDIKIIPTGMVESDFLLENKEELEQFKIRNPIFQNDTLLFVGRVVMEKNILFLLESFHQVSKEFPNLQLIYIGKGIGSGKIFEKAKKYGIQERVHILDPVPREELRYYYHSCKIFAFPSLSETQGLVVLEAMLCKKPVVGIDAMGVGETMRHSNSGGLISKPNDLFGYTNNLRKLLSDQKLYNEKAQEAYEIGKEWSIKPMYQRLKTAYEELITTIAQVEITAKSNDSLTVGH